MSHPLLTVAPPAAQAPHAAARPRRAGRRVPHRALVDFTRSFAVMTSARLTITQCLATAERQCRHEGMRRTLAAVRASVRAGRSLSDSFADHPRVFDALYVQLTRIGEAAGVLDEVLLRLAAHQEKTDAMKRKIKTAMAYPAAVLLVALAATAFLLTTIVPTFAEMFEDFGAELPAATQFVLNVSTLVTDHLLALLGGAVLLGGLPAWARRTDRGRLLADRLVLRLPLVGGLVLQTLVARCCRTLGTLLASGVALVDALEILHDAAGNRVVADEVARLRRRVRRGSSLNRPLEEGALFPPMVVQMIAVGEQTAELDRMLLHAAGFYEEAVDAALETATALLEPVLIVGIGVFLGGILAALYLPMFDMMTLLG